jgi:hypothetical protein
MSKEHRSLTLNVLAALGVYVLVFGLLKGLDRDTSTSFLIASLSGLFVIAAKPF